MKLLRCLLLLLLAIALPFNAAMAGFAQLEEGEGDHPSVVEKVSIHEHRSIFGDSEQHTHKVGDEVKLDGCKSCSFTKGVPSLPSLPHPIVPTSSVWTGSEDQFPNDHAPAPPERPPKKRA
ncbi:hypothetical protein [Pseudogulbenkiania subflava]|uniref:Uncharacterized protein n=1 Tax=Pseudogulbenkiania subflava DSM 22618 TaxID=1123014 RepID=A0A1Y6BH38_9NEIS|nr:hypothetical protein [Pseudogulbenkiania subflava]SMF03630.1 hypothetical protein SAMN02745746_00888 [Pseudogulbenkiania subflava DSM 22618]